jgi:hypothetical protein
LIKYLYKNNYEPFLTGLDPALPFIDLNDIEKRLDTGDAPFVDVIHTDGDTFGLSVPIGHVDFYPNGGRKTQPGCGIFDTPASLNFLDRGQYYTVIHKST